MSSHHPDLATYLGPDPAGNFRFSIESSSSPGTFHYTLVRPDGAWAACSCRGYHDHNHCGMTDGAMGLAQRGLAHYVATQALDVAMGSIYNIQEGLDVDVTQLLQWEARVDGLLEVLDAA